MRKRKTLTDRQLEAINEARDITNHWYETGESFKAGTNDPTPTHVYIDVHTLDRLIAITQKYMTSYHDAIDELDTL